MPRVVKSAEDRQGEILDVSERLFAERGYAKTSVQTIIDTVGIAKGTFYHHFRSKSELLDAMVQRVAAEIFTHLQPVLDDPTSSAPDKLVTYFQRAGSYKAARAGFIVDLFRALELEANAQVKARLHDVSVETTARHLARIIAQGVDEGAFDCRHPQHTGRSVQAVFESSRAIWAQAMAPGGPDRFSREELLAMVAAQQDDIERLLGAAPGTLPLTDPAIVDRFLDAAKART